MPIRINKIPFDQLHHRDHSILSAILRQRVKIVKKISSETRMVSQAVYIHGER